MHCLRETQRTGLARKIIDTSPSISLLLPCTHYTYALPAKKWQQQCTTYTWLHCLSFLPIPVGLAHRYGMVCICCCRVACACWSLHYGKRLLETIFIHRFSHSTMPIRNIFKVVFHATYVQHITRGQSNLTKSASRGGHSPVRGHPRGSKVVPLNSWSRVSY